MHLGLPDGLQHVFLDPGTEYCKLIHIRITERPCSYQSLIEQVLFVAVWCRLGVDNYFMLTVLAAPAGKRLAPWFRHLREHVDPGPDILTAFGIMGRCGQHGQRTALAPFDILAMECLQGDAEPLR